MANKRRHRVHDIGVEQKDDGIPLVDRYIVEPELVEDR